MGIVQVTQLLLEADEKTTEEQEAKIARLSKKLKEAREEIAEKDQDLTVCFVLLL